MEREKFLKEFGFNLKIARLRKGLTQEELAEQSNCTAPYIGYIERGLKCPTVYRFVQIAQVLNMDTGDFLKSL